MSNETKPITNSEAFALMLALELRLDTLDDESLTDEQMAGIAVKFIMDRLPALQDLQTECTALRVNKENLTAQVESLRAQLAARVPDASKVLHWFYAALAGDISRKEMEQKVAALLSAAPSQQAPVAQGDPVAWLVCSVNKDGSLSLEHAAAWQEAAHEHINDAITEYGIEDAATWVVRPAYTHAQQASEPMTPEQKRQSWVNATIEQCSHEGCYMRGIEDAEQFHNIKGKQ